MSYAKLLDSIILKQKAKKTKPQRRIGDAVFKMIVEMAYEMKNANRYCEAERSNLFIGKSPTNWIAHPGNHNLLPFDSKDVKYNKVQLGDILVLPFWIRDYSMGIRLAKVIRINKKSLTTKDCDQDGQLVEYNPEDDHDFATKEHRKDYNKLYPHLGNRQTETIITGTKHLRYEGWDS